MSVARRILVILGILPVMLFAVLWWIATGKQGDTMLVRFLKWGGIDR